MTQMEVPGQVPEWTMCDRLRKARELTGLGQREFAVLIGVSKATVTNAEKGHTALRRPTLNSWALATGVPSTWLETGVDPRTWSPPRLPRLDSNQEPSGSLSDLLSGLPVAS